MGKKILVINPGSTSTKLAIFDDDRLVIKEELFIDTEVVSQFKTAYEQLELRRMSVEYFLTGAGFSPSDLDIIVARGGSLPPMPGGAFTVNDLMVNELKYAPYAQHASNLGCMIARLIGDPVSVPCIIYDAPGADEFDPMAKVTGLPEVTIVPVSHVLNTRKVARDVAKSLGKAYEDCNFIVAHLGGGISINVHTGGRIVDSVYDDMGPMSPQRAGRIPTRFMTTLCYSGKYTESEMRRRLTNDGGLSAYLGTQDLRKVVQMMEEGNELAIKLFNTMAYQIAKGIGELSTVVCGKVDRIILTGGAAHRQNLCDLIAGRVSFIAPMEVVPGEKEMEALAEGGLRVLNGIEPAKTYTVLPEGYASEYDFNAFVAKVQNAL